MGRIAVSRAHRLLPALLAVALCAGCASLVEDVAVREDVKELHEDVALVEGDLAHFRRCLEERGGTCQGDAETPLPHSHGATPTTPLVPGGSRTLADSVAALAAGHPAKIAQEVLSDPVTGQAAALYNHLRGQGAGSTPGVTVTRGQGAHGGPESTVTMDLPLDQVRHFHGRLLASLGRGWDALHGHCQALLAVHRDAPDLARIEADCRRAAFVRGYLDAYLRHGEFVEVDVKLAGASSAIDEEAAKIKGDIGALRGQIAELEKELDQDVEHELGQADEALSNVFKVSKVGFISRDATFSARLPTLEVTLDPTAKHLLTVSDVDTGQLLTTESDFGHLGVARDASGVGTGAAVGAEVVRVFLEAIFDAHEGLPAVAAANLGGAKPTGLTLGSYSLPLFRSPTGDVDSHDLTRMTHVNDAAALKTRLLVGRIISGIGPFSLNNPPLESLITEVVATSVRKAVAKASWCWYACNLNVEVEKLAGEVETAAKDELAEEEKRLEAAARGASSWMHQEAEHVKLRLKLNR